MISAIGKSLLNIDYLTKWIAKLVWQGMSWSACFLVKSRLEPILMQSHRVFLDRRRWQQRWEPLVDQLEFNLVRKMAYESSSLASSRIYVRNRRKSTVDRIELSVIARVGKLERVSNVTIKSLVPDIAQVCLLPDFPIEDLNIVRDNIVPSYDTCFIRIHEVNVDGVVTSKGHETRDRHPTHFSYLNGSWTRMFGKVWNTDAVKDIKQGLDDSLRRHLIVDTGVFGLHSIDLFQFALRYRRYAVLGNVAAYAILRNFILIHCVCWIALIFGMKKIPPFDPTFDGNISK